MKFNSLTVLLSFIIVVGFIAGCGSQSQVGSQEEGELPTAVEKEEENNEHGVPISVVESIRENLEGQSAALDEGDLDTYKIFLQKEPQNELNLKRLMDRKPTTSITNLDVIYMIEDEALAIVKSKTMTEEYMEDSNYNSTSEYATLFKLVDDNWLETNHGVSIETIYLDGEGERSDLYTHQFNNEAALQKIEEIVESNELPSIYFEMESALTDEAEKAWTRLFDLYTIESEEDIYSIATDTFLYPEPYHEAYLNMADAFIEWDYKEIDPQFFSTFVHERDENTFTYDVNIQVFGITSEAEAEAKLIERLDVVVDMEKDDNGQWKIVEFRNK
ncbi:hypothetical protein [Alkalihalobacterium sp. APHAB7]|uniref:hypothetical protein n=1 Tax=Alkalihalobacterium sp. APHAB7 TaxID=3402081 RepID=UPI003AAC7E4C